MEGEETIEIPDPVLYAPVEFIDEGEVVTYTDCWQISVLRFLHLLFGQAGTIIKERLSRHMDQSKPCLDLIAYFDANPTYQMSQQFYKTAEGLAIRAKWCQFLNASGLFYLKLKGKYQVAATIPNTLAFIHGFFPKVQANFNEIEAMTMENLTSDRLFTSYEEILGCIYKQLSPTLPLTVSMDSVVHNGEEQVFFTINQKLSLKGRHVLDWEISECYAVEGEEIGARLGGHSDYRYCTGAKPAVELF